MAAKSPSKFSTLSQTQPGALTEFVRHFSAGGCDTAADVRARTAQVRKFRAKAYKSQPAAPAAPALPVLVKQLPAVPAASLAPADPAVPVLIEQVPAVPGRISVLRVLEVTAKHFCTEPNDLVSHCKKHPLVRHRQIAMYVAHEVTGHSLPFIAQHIGGRDHTTILHGVRIVQALIDAGDNETIAAVNQIIEQLQGQEARMTDASEIERLAESGGARVHKGSESDRGGAKDGNGMTIVSGAMSIAEAARLYCKDKGLPSSEEILDRIVAAYRPYHVLDEFWDGFTAFYRGDLKNPYRDADGYARSVKARAWDRGANVAMQYQRALAQRATAPDEAGEAEPGWLVRLLRTGRCA